jgi:hypothetical protein
MIIKVNAAKRFAIDIAASIRPDNLASLAAKGGTPTFPIKSGVAAKGGTPTFPIKSGGMLAKLWAH